MDVFDPNILQRVFSEAILQVGMKKSIGDLGPECPFKAERLIPFSFHSGSLVTSAFATRIIIIIITGRSDGLRTRMLYLA